MEYTSVNLNAVGVKAKSKGEMYRTLVTEGKLYLMGQRECGLAFLSDICCGRKKVFFCDEIRVCQVPHIHGLRSEDVIDFIVNKCEGEDYLPSNYIAYPPNKSWLCNIDPAAFGALVKEMTIKREEHILDKSNLIIKMDPRIARIFHNSHNVSSKSQRLSFMLAEKGKSHKLLRKALLRDRKIIKEEENKELDRAVKSIPGLVDEINQLLFEIQEKNDKIQAYDKDQEILIKLFDMGVINGDGDLINQEKCENMD